MLPPSVLLKANWFSNQGIPSLVPTESFEELHQLPLWRNAGIKQDDKGLIFAIHLHAYYSLEAIQLIHLISESCPGAHLFVTYSDDSILRLISSHLSSRRALQDLHSTKFIRVPNAGRNVIPLFILINKMLKSYDIALHLHTKRSPHFEEGNTWSRHMTSSLLGDRELVLAILTQFINDPKLGLVMPTAYRAIKPDLGWGSNLSLAKSLSKQLNPPILIHEAMPLVFPAGMMFWFRPALFSNLADVYLKSCPAEHEPLPQDGTYLHAVERLLAFVCESNGFRWFYISPSRKQVNRQWRILFRPLSILEPCLLRYRLIIFNQLTYMLLQRLRRLIARALSKARSFMSFC